MARRQRPTGKRPNIAGMYSSPTLLQKALGPAAPGGRDGILHVFDTARIALKAGERLRVLEMGGGSGRLAAHLIKHDEIRPEDYVLSDRAYGTDRAPFLKRKIRSAAAKGCMQVLPLDFEKAPPSDIGKFHVIMLPEVSGTPRVLNNMLQNYWPNLQPGGLMVVNRAGTTHAAVELACGAAPRKRFQLLSHQTEGLTDLLNRLNELKRAGQVDFDKPGDLFVNPALHNELGVHSPYNDVFILQKRAP